MKNVWRGCFEEMEEMQRWKFDTCDISNSMVSSWMIQVQAYVIIS